MFRKILSGLVVLILVGAIVLVVIAPARLTNDAKTPEIQGDLTTWLARRELAVDQSRPIIPEAEKRIRWYADRQNTKTPYSIVYLHGFSATRQEIAPVGAMISDELKANLFETRLTGHGHQQKPLESMKAEDWLDDAAEALTIGAAIGHQIIVMGTSNGASLALAMIDHSSFEPVSFIILLSPNFGPQDPKSDLMTWPGGPQLANAILGETRSWTPANELQALYWSTSYPTEALIEMMRLVKFVRGKLPLNLSQSVLTIYSPADTVVDTNRIVSAFEEMSSPGKQIISIPGSGDRSNHVLAGNIMAPENNRPIVEQVVRFVRKNSSKRIQ